MGRVPDPVAREQRETDRAIDRVSEIARNADLATLAAFQRWAMCLVIERQRALLADSDAGAERERTET